MAAPWRSSFGKLSAVAVVTPYAAPCRFTGNKVNEDNDLHQTMAMCLLAAAFLGAAAAAQANDFPRSGYDGAPNGLAAPLAGTWSLGFPEPEGTVVSTTTIDCADPVLIEETGNASIAFKTPGMTSPVAFELDVFEGRTSWIPADNTQTIVVVWLTEDSFHFYATDMGRVDWANPSLLKRCPA
jgi:hypothetical protein